MSEENSLISGRKRINIEFVDTAKIFLVACVSGAVFIALGVAFHSVVMAVLLPIITMVIYIFIVLRSKSDLPISILGDSFYYLGFIFTLVALVSSLVSLSAGDNVNMNSVVGSFGAALTTTILGLISRLVITSFSIQAKERRERIENEIERSLTTFSAQLDVLTNQVVASITKVHAQTEAALGDSLRSYKNVNDQLNEQYKSSMQKGSTDISAAMEGVAQRVNQLDIAPDTLSKPLINSLKGITDTLLDHQKNHEHVNKQLLSSNEKLAHQFDQTGEIIQQHVSKVEQAISSSITLSSEEYQKSLSQIGDAIVSSLDDVKDIKFEAKNQLQEQFRVLGQEVDGVVAGLVAIKAPIELSVAELNSGQDTLRKGISSFKKSTLSIADIVKETTVDVSELSSFRTEITELKQGIVDVNEQLVKMTGVSEDALNSMNAAASVTEKTSTQVAEDIATVYKSLALQIRALKGVS